MNFVCETDGVAGAVLIRAAEPLEDPSPIALRGPGKLCRGLDVTLAHNGLDLTSPKGPLSVVDDGVVLRVARSARIGVERAGVMACPELARELQPF